MKISRKKVVFIGVLMALLLGIIGVLIPSPKLEPINLYVLDNNAEYMLPVETLIEPNPEAVIKYLIKAKGGGFPKATKLINFYIEGNRAYVNLNKEYDEANHGDNMVVANLYSIFYTLTLNEFFSIDEVQVLVDGDTILAPMERISLEVMTPELRTALLSRTSFYPGQSVFEN